MSVFVDTSALYALLVETEEDHRAVLRSFEQLLRKGRLLFTTNYVVVESAALLQQRFGLAPIRDLVDCVSFEFMEEEGIQQALALDRDFEDEGFKTLPSQHRGR